MKHDLEYPATHSMSTAWFAIDLDGNVAILEFNNNGPVPDGIPDTCSEVVISETLSEPTQGMGQQNWTDEQIEEFIKRLQDDKGEDLWDKTIIQIDTKQTDDFVKLFTSRPQTEYSWADLVCISEQRGLYIADFSVLNEEEGEELIKRKTILRHQSFYIWNNDTYSLQEGKLTFVHEFDHLPFYLYQQPYCTDDAMRRTYSPLYPFKENQLPLFALEKALRIPIRFDDYNELQIAQYFPFSVYETRVVIDGKEGYYRLPLHQEQEAYILPDTLPYVWCGKTCRKCFKPEEEDAKLYLPQQFTETPTLVIINGVFTELDPEWRDKWPLLRYAAAIPVIYGIPGPKVNFLSPKDAHQLLKSHGYGKLFEQCKTHLEEILDLLKPHALILFPETRALLRRFYPMEDRQITIGNEVYPFFMYEQLDQEIDHIRTFAERPYRGTVVNRIRLADDPHKEH